MANAEHLAILRQGVEVWNQWRENQLHIVPDLENANLRNAQLGRVDFIFDSKGNVLKGEDSRRGFWDEHSKCTMNSFVINFRGVILRGSDLSGANLEAADLEGADLKGADINGANLRGANLKEADLRKAKLGEVKLMESNLFRANLAKANLRGAILTFANLWGTNLKGVDFTGVNFEKVQISQDTVIAKKWHKVWEITNQKSISQNCRGIDLSGANFSGANLKGFDFSGADLSNTDLTRANLRETIISQDTVIEEKWRKVWEIVNQKVVDPNFTGVDFSGADLNNTNLSGFDFSDADFSNADIGEANLSNAKLWRTNLKKTLLSRDTVIEEKWRKVWEIVNQKVTTQDFNGMDLCGANLSNTNLNGFDFSYVNFEGANLSKIQALGTNFTSANLTGACIEDWNINSATNLTDVICEYIYRRQGEQERRPSSGNFAPGEFTKLFQKSLETVDIIFRNGIDWDAFAYSFKKVEVENQGAQLDVQSIEKKGDGVILVRVAVAPDADKAKIHNEFMQGYEFAAKALEAQYQARLEDKEKVINQLFSTINQQNKLLAQTGDKVSIYYQPNSQFAGGIVDANTANIDQMGGSINNNNA